MNWRAFAKPNSWYEPAQEMLWQLSGSATSVENPTWNLEQAEVKRISIRWPQSFEWPQAQKWVSHLETGLSKYVPVRRENLAQPTSQSVVLELMYAGEKHLVAIDYSDYPSIDVAMANRCLLYFKMQFSHQGYDQQNVLPGGYVPNDPCIYNYLPKLRALRDTYQNNFDLYGRFNFKFAEEIRRNAFKLLVAQNKFDFAGSRTHVRYSRYLKELAQAKACLDLPGNGDLCFRLIDYFAVGSCVIGPKRETLLHVPLEDRTHMAFCKRDLSDLIDLCAYYIEDETARFRLINNSRKYFDKYLHREQLASYYLSQCIKLLGS